MHITDHGPTRKPATSARIYDSYLGGVHNFPADRHTADTISTYLPRAANAARANRAFVRHAVRDILGAGVRQFLDIGAGIPTPDHNVHDLARTTAPDTRVVYVDSDSSTVAELLERLSDPEHADAIRSDLRTPQTILTHRTVRRMIDFTEPVGLLLAAVLHYLPDTDQAHHAVAYLTEALPVGSYVVISHPAAETYPPQSPQYTAAMRTYQQYTGHHPTPRDHDTVQKFFAGLQLLDPGLVDAHHWHTPPAPQPAEPTAESGVWVGVGAKT
ncbi:SAM-dependent methyltransferase [Rugosimonospora acidiphila]|uniref:SAM-dependent methyltransferase n=1 Tax=Rugosimonospora acidiphila TaxID=556531 RepID=A0ABP9ST34_9ACTN